MGLLDIVRPLFSAGGTEKDAGQGYVKEESLIAEIRDLRDSSLRVRTDEEREWLKAWNFYKGRHWITWREDRWVESEANDRPKIVVNFIQHVVQTRLGHLIKNKPMLIGVPGNADEKSRQASRLALKALEAYHHKLKLQKKYKEAILHMLVTGKSYLQSGWDPFIGGTWERPNPKDPTKPFSGPLGDLTCDVRRVHEVLPEPGTKDLDDSQRVVVRTFLPLAQVRRMYGAERTKDLQPIDPATREGSGMLRALYGFEGAIPAAVHNRVEVLEVFYRGGVDRAEGGQYEQGLRAVIAGDKLMMASGTPAGYAEVPLVEFSEIDTDTFYSTSVSRQLIDTNKIVDVELSQQEHNRKVMRPKTLIPYQANIAEGAWDKTDDEIVEFFAPYRPEAYEPPALPAHHLELRNALITLLKELGGNFDVLSGKAQSDVRSGRMVSYLQEYAGTVLGVVAQNLEFAMEQLGNQQLHLLQEYVREDRLEAYVGRDRRMEIVSFKGADIKGCTAVRVQPDSALPTSRAEKFDRIERWIDKQFIPPDKGMKMLNMVDPDTDLYSDDEADREVADEVCYKLSRVDKDALALAEKTAQQKTMLDMQSKAAAGLPAVPPDAGMQERNVLRVLGVEAFEFENHQAIIDQVNRAYRKTQLYRDSIPGLRALVDAFVDWHTLLSAGIDPDNPLANVQAIAEAQGMAPPPEASGAPGGGSGGPPAPTDGSPLAMHPGQGPGGPGGIGPAPQSMARESGPESASGLPPVRPAPGPMHR
jgi:hypothetical protein